MMKVYFFLTNGRSRWIKGNNFHEFDGVIYHSNIEIVYIPKCGYSLIF